jgi:hypothetical protein
MTVRTFALGLMFMSASVFQLYAQKGNNNLISQYLKLTRATYHFRGQGMVRKKPASQSPRKVYDVEFIAIRDCALNNLFASIGNKQVKGRVLYNNSINDSAGVSKGQTVIFEFIPPLEIANQKDVENNKGRIRVSFCINDAKVAIFFTFKEKKDGINDLLYQ